MEALLNSLASRKSFSGVSIPVGTLSSSEGKHSLRTSERLASAWSQHSKPKHQSVNATLQLPPKQFETALLESASLSDELNYAARRLNTGSSSSAPPQSESLSLVFLESVQGKTPTPQHKSRTLERIEDRRSTQTFPLHKLRQGGFVESCLIYRQIFVIRSYEVGSDRTASMETLLSLFQEMALCHVQLLGISGRDGFGATHAMTRCRLIWVVTQMHVEVERYPAWPEVVEIDTWTAPCGKNKNRRDWVMRSYQTGEVLARSTSTWVMMNRDTRRMSKLPDEVKAELEPCYVDRWAFSPSKVIPKIDKLTADRAQFSSCNLTPCRKDLDLNEHVSNLKYLSWVLESVPPQTIETRELASITLEYRRECTGSDVVESFTAPEATDTMETNINGNATSGSELSGINGSHGEKSFWDLTATPPQFTHLLRTQGEDSEIVRARTCWRQPRKNSSLH